MSFFKWLVPKPAAPQSSGLPSDGLTVPPLHAPPHRPPVVAPDTDLKTQRQERREQLYSVVRDAMLRSGVLAASYKFKVLSLDLRGRQFLIMVDLQDAHVLPVTQFMALEHLIVANAAQQHDLQVKAIYWRVNEHPEAVPEVHKRILEATLPRQTVRSREPGFEPIGQDEVMAFKRAVAKGSSSQIQVPQGETHTSGPRHPSPPSGFEDTQLLEPDDAASPLSRTQFGDL